MMSSYEVMKRTIEFTAPDRVPIIVPSCGVEETFGVGPKAGGKELSPRERLDEWGCLWQKSEVKNMGQVKGHPLTDWAKMKDYPFPNAADDSRYAHIPAALGKAGDKFVILGNSNGLFERLYFLHGYEPALLDLYENSDRVHALLDIILDFHVTTVKKVAALAGKRIHAYRWCDDLGSQKQAVMSVPMFREFFKPRYRKLFDACHAAGWNTWLHSCGKVNELIPELADAGLDVINLQQPRALGIEEVASKYSGIICFECPLDIQTTLPFGTKDEMFAEAKLLIETWGTPRGGFIASDYGDGEAIGAPPAKKQMMLDAFRAAANQRMSE